MKMETLQQRRDELERKEQKLKESLLKFDKFVKVNSTNTIVLQWLNSLHKTTTIITGERLEESQST